VDIDWIDLAEGGQEWWVVVDTNERLHITKYFKPLIRGMS
jgi:hypothetical protein